MASRASKELALESPTSFRNSGTFASADRSCSKDEICHFWGFPQELRDEIYQFACNSPDPVLIPGKEIAQTSSTDVCKRRRFEAYPWFARRTTFHFHSAGALCHSDNFKDNVESIIFDYVPELCKHRICRWKGEPGTALTECYYLRAPAIGIHYIQRPYAIGAWDAGVQWLSRWSWGIYLRWRALKWDLCHIVGLRNVSIHHFKVTRRRRRGVPGQLWTEYVHGSAIEDDLKRYFRLEGTIKDVSKSFLRHADRIKAERYQLALKNAWSAG